MKFKTTAKQLKENYSNIICANEISNLLTLENPIAYNSGVYGWNYDVYEISNDIIIVTGYRVFNTKIKPCYELQRKYSDKARELKEKYWDYEELKPLLHELLLDFVKEVLEK